MKDVALDVLRHRVLLTYEADAEGVTSEQMIGAGAVRGGGAVTAAELARKVRLVELRARQARPAVESRALITARSRDRAWSFRRCANTCPATIRAPSIGT